MSPASEEWKHAVDKFLEYLPGAIESWIVLANAGLHNDILRSLQHRLHIEETLILGQVSQARVRSAATAYSYRNDVGLLDFLLAGAHHHYSGRYADAVGRFSAWPAHRVRLCLDVWDANFAALFAEGPSDITPRCQALAAQLADKIHLTYRGRNASNLGLDCSGAAWTVYTGVQDYDYNLPTGEVACLPRSVEGQVDVQGWIVGTVPLGLKYGRIRDGDLTLTFSSGVVTSVSGGRRELCGDMERLVDEVPGLNKVGELGFGQSFAVEAARDLHSAAYLWHEKHFGMHLGLGAELAETFDVGDRVTGHHVDIVLAEGAVLDDRGGALLTW